MIPDPAELAALHQQLTQAAPKPARAQLCGKLLAGWGGLLRAGKDDVPLAPLAPDDVELYLNQVDTRSIEADLHRASEAALEAAITEGAEQLEWQQWTLEALAARDLLDAALVGVERWLQGPAPRTLSAPRVLERIAQELGRIDARGPSIARTLVAANVLRRAARDRLGPAHRARAWWFSARAECDALVALWRDPQVPPPETAHCGPCAEDRARARLAQRPPQRCVTADELWLLEGGELPAPRRRLVQRHAGSCPECALAVSAAVVPVLDEEPVPEPSRQVVPPVELAHCPQFRVLAFRGARTRVQIEAAPGVSFSEVVVQVAAARLRGLEHDLGPSQRLQGQRVVVTATLASGERVHLELAL